MDQVPPQQDELVQVQAFSRSHVAISGAVCILAGVLTLVYYAKSRPRLSSPAESPTKPAVSPMAKYETFISSILAQEPLVLIALTNEDDTPLVKLCRRNQVQVHNVSFAKIAGRAMLTSTLLERFPGIASTAVEALFFHGELVGDTESVLEMARTGVLSERLGLSVALEEEEQLKVLQWTPPTNDIVASAPASRLPDSLSALLAWTPHDSAAVPLAVRPRATNTCRSQLLVYISCETPSLPVLPWAIIDTIVFHAADLLSLPQAGWIDAAHRNGVRVLASLTWSSIESSTAADWQQLAKQLHRIQGSVGFDGWHVDCPLRDASILAPLMHKESFVLFATDCVDEKEALGSLLQHFHGLVVKTPLERGTINLLARAAGANHWQLYFRPSGDDDDAPTSARLFRFTEVSVWISHTALEDPFWARNWRDLTPVHDSFGGVDTLYTSFNIGSGSTSSCGGQVVRSEPWVDATQVDMLPLLGSVNSTIRASFDTSFAFHGGSSLRLEGMLGPKERATLELFKVQMQFEPLKPIRVAYTCRSDHDPTTFGVVLTLATKQELVLRAATAGSTTPLSSTHLSPLVGRAKNGHVYGATAQVDHGHGWVTRVYHLGGAVWDGKVIRAIGVFGINLQAQESTPWSMHLGQLVVCRLADLPPHPPSLKDIRLEESCSRLAWTVNSSRSVVQYTHVFQGQTDGSKTWLGRTNTTTWPLLAPEEATPSTKIFVLAPVDWSGAVGDIHRVRVVVADGL
ncbi:unnamed protein product [Aphanomyces euteiches]